MRLLPEEKRDDKYSELNLLLLAGQLSSKCKQMVGSEPLSISRLFLAFFLTPLRRSNKLLVRLNGFNRQPSKGKNVTVKKDKFFTVNSQKSGY